jgi:hypothetical protein
MGCFYDTDIDVYDSSTNSNRVFMIGVGHEENNKWIYKSFYMKQYTSNEEMSIVDDAIKYINTISGDTIPTLFHWGNAEVTMINSLNRRHNYKWTKWIDTVNWLDFCKVFINEPIVVKGAKKFGLKEIAKAMYNNGLIKSKWTDNLTSGLDAMISAAQLYRSCNTINNKDLLDIIKYNEIDCKVIYEIVEYLRDNHI